MARKRTRSLTGPRKRKEKETAGSTTNKRKRAVGPTEAVVEEEPHRSERAEARREEVGVGVDAVEVVVTAPQQSVRTFGRRISSQN